MGLYVLVNSSSIPMVTNHCDLTKKFLMCGLNCLPRTTSMFMSALTRLVSTSYVSLPRLMTSDQLHVYATSPAYQARPTLVHNVGEYFICLFVPSQNI